jgi:hypothetical protein
MTHQDVGDEGAAQLLVRSIQETLLGSDHKRLVGVTGTDDSVGKDAQGESTVVVRMLGRALEGFI